MRSTPVADSPGSAAQTTPVRKTRSLGMPDDPIARMREMHELDNPTTALAAPLSAPVEPPAGAQAVAAAAERTHPESNNESILASNQDSNHASKKDSRQEGNQSGNHSTNHVRKTSSGSSGGGGRDASPSGAGESDIVRALRRALNAPYADLGPRAPLNTISTRVPSEIFERLDLACSLTGLKKQEVMTQALRDYFDKLAGEGE